MGLFLSLYSKTPPKNFWYSEKEEEGEERKKMRKREERKKKKKISPFNPNSGSALACMKHGRMALLSKLVDTRVDW